MCDIILFWVVHQLPPFKFAPFTKGIYGRDIYNARYFHQTKCGPKIPHHNKFIMNTMKSPMKINSANKTIKWSNQNCNIERHTPDRNEPKQKGNFRACNRSYQNLTLNSVESAILQSSSPLRPFSLLRLNLT